MPSYAILIDDGRYVASAPTCTYPDMSTAVRSTMQAAALIALDEHADVRGDATLECEVQDRASREVKRFSVAVVTRIHDR